MRNGGTPPLVGTIDLIIDVRSPTEYASAGDPTAHDTCGHGFSDKWDGCEVGHIPGAYLVPLNPWDVAQLERCSSSAGKPVKDMTVATTCYNHASHPDSAWRSNTGAALLEQAGFKCVFNIVDGTKVANITKVHTVMFHSTDWGWDSL